MEKSEEKIDYSSTVNLPKTAFSMKGNLPQREPEMLKFWDQIGLYQKIQQKNAGGEWFLLHDGPPYANGHIHMGTTLNKVLKDFVVKYKNMRGFRSPYVPGWDCHGLPVEHQLLKEMKKTKHDVELLPFRSKAKEYALKWVNIQRGEFQRLGILGQWDKPYLTMNPAYEARELKCFGQLYFDGYIYKGLKPIHWCSSCETALAEAEVEYRDKTSDSIYVKFPAKEELSRKFGVEKAFVIIWTTTPWTLPANLAIALKPDFTYTAVKVGEEVYIAAKETLERLKSELGWENLEVVGECKGAELENLAARHPFIDRDSRIVLAEQEDYFTALKYKIKVYSPVDSEGKFTSEVPQYEGEYVFDANTEIVEDLKQRNMLIGRNEIAHSYPHCWRCKKPVIFRATRQWFINVDHNGLRENTLEEIKKVRWIPGFGIKRITSMVSIRPDWCLSRQRLWGVPIPLLYCRQCGKELLTPQILEKVVSLVSKKGVDVWFEVDTADLLPENTSCGECGGTSFVKEMDILDVWFDSGVSHQSVLDISDNLKYPCELYLEGSDQHRGWFQTSILTAVSLTGTAPFQTVLTHGYTLDEKGEKESKSRGNVTSPLDIIKRYGAEILRLWVSSVDYSSDIAVSGEGFGQMADAYRKIRNTLRFLLGNLNDFDPEKNLKSYRELTEIDKWVLARTQELIRDVSEAYDNFEFHKVHHLIYNYCTVELSSFYLDILKDRLYTFAADSPERRSSQSVFYYLVETLSLLLAPLLSFTTEEVWQLCRRADDPESIHLADFPQVKPEWEDAGLTERWDRLKKIRAEAAKLIENMRARKQIGNSLECKIDLLTENEEQFEFLKSFNGELASIFIVSQINVEKVEKAVAEQENDTVVHDGTLIKVSPAEGEKCKRCWRFQTSTGADSQYPEICERCAKIVVKLS